MSSLGGTVSSSRNEDITDVGDEPARKVLFLSVGQTPRADLIDDMLESVDIPIDAIEVGALDGLSAEEIERFRVRPGEASIITRLANNTDIVVSKPRIGRRMADIVSQFQPRQFDLIVILSTGLFGDFESTCPTVNAQRAVESAVLSLATQGSYIGVVQPLEKQVSELTIPAFDSYKITASYASDSDRASLARAMMDLAHCEIIVLNSVSFTEADREIVAKASGKTVVLARRIIASAIRLLLYRKQPMFMPDATPEFSKRLASLTPRERQVMSLVAEGISNKAIARQLDISPKTVENHRANMLRKMKVNSSGALIRMVVSAGRY